MVGNVNQSEVWKSFRVGRRAHIRYKEEQKNLITAAHDGYSRLGITHRRKFNCNGSTILIYDEIIGDKNGGNCAYIHFHPSVSVKK